MARGADAGIEFGLTSCGLERGGRLRIGLAPCGFSGLQAPTIGQGLPSPGVLVLVELYRSSASNWLGFVYGASSLRRFVCRACDWQARSAGTRGGLSAASVKSLGFQPQPRRAPASEAGSAGAAGGRIVAASEGQGTSVEEASFDEDLRPASCFLPPPSFPRLCRKLPQHGRTGCRRPLVRSVSSSEDITKPQKLDLHFVRPRTPFLRAIS